MEEINTVVFDLGSVLVDWNPAYLYRKLFEKEEEMQWFLENVTSSDWNEMQDAGRSLAEGTRLLIEQFPEQEEKIRAYYDRWEEMLGGPIEETVALLKMLRERQDLRLYALTNWSSETFPIALEKYAFLDWFDGRLVSGEEKMRKPFPEIYERLIDRFDIDPKRALFTDDNPRNLKPAQEMGFRTHHFQSPATFRICLQSLHLL